jgi:nuclear control of ATPase protein 2
VSNSFYTTLTLPVELARHECRHKLKKLEEIRDNRSYVLGQLLGLREYLASSLTTTSTEERAERLQSFVKMFRGAVDRREDYEGNADPTEYSLMLVSTILPKHTMSHQDDVKRDGLQRPSRLTLVWPKLVFLPPIALLAARWAYHSKDSLRQTALDAVDTLKGFWEDWLLGPLKDVVKTVRAGSDEGVIITKESVKADLEVGYWSSLRKYLAHTFIVPGEDGSCACQREVELHT